jgi:hypothetical protein
MADVDGIVQIESRDEFGEIIGVSVEIVPIPGLTGTPVASAVVRDATVSPGAQEDHLVLPRVGG